MSETIEIATLEQVLKRHFPQLGLYEMEAAALDLWDTLDPDGEFLEGFRAGMEEGGKVAREEGYVDGFHAALETLEKMQPEWAAILGEAREKLRCQKASKIIEFPTGKPCP